MIVASGSLDLAFRGFKTVYTDAFDSSETHYQKIAMTVPSSARDESRGWLGQIPQLREWVGGRHVKNLTAYGFTIEHRTFEATVAVKRTDFEDDRLGVFKPMFAQMGSFAARHPEELVFKLLASGFSTECFDGQNFFDSDRPVEIDGAVQNVSNMQSGSSTPWFLVDTSQMIRPIIWQERTPYEFQSMHDSDDPHVFMNDEHVYGVRARVNAGFGLWQRGLRIEGHAGYRQLRRSPLRNGGVPGGWWPHPGREADHPDCSPVARSGRPQAAERHPRSIRRLERVGRHRRADRDSLPVRPTCNSGAKPR